MKIKFILLIFSVLILSSLSAENRPDVAVRMLNKGKLTIVGDSSDKTYLYVGGSFIATSAQEGESSDLKSEIIVNNARLSITGHFINNVSDGTVFIQTEDIIPGVIEFNGTAQQWITTDGVTYSSIPSKESNFINFPNLLINNSSHVKITPEIAVKTIGIDLTKGWLIVDSRTPDIDKDYPLDKGNIAAVNNQTVFAHLQIDGDISYKNWEAPDVNERGFIQVNMALQNEGKNVSADANEGRPVVSLVGFGSPFEELRADYFMYNILVEPDHTGFFGKRGGPNRYPDNILKQGIGKILAIDLKENQFAYEEYGSPWSQFSDPEIFEHRAKDGFYYFNRHQFSVDPERKLTQIFGTSPTHNAYLNERLTNPREYIEIPLCAGYNYLANPFLVPLDASDLLIESSTPNSWNVIVKGTSGDTSRDIYNAVWLLNPDSKAEYKGNLKADFFYNYRILQYPGGTEESELIAPLQMFVIWAAKDTYIRIPKSARKMGDVKFIRSSRQVRQDDFIVEVIDETTYTSDRTNFVLRSASEIASKYNDRNVIHSTSSSTEKSGNPSASRLGSQLFTKGTDGKELMVNFLPIETTKRIQLYLKSSSVEQTIILQGLRLTSMANISGMWLEDKMERTITPFTEETRYKTVSRPTDIEDRFILHFEKPQTLFSEGTIISYYNDRKIFVEGFMQEDYGSKIYVYEINGSLLSQAIVDNYRVSISAPFPQGVYLIKVMGNNSYSAKIIIK